MISLFAYDFMIRALIACLLIGTIAPTIGYFFVVRRYSNMADTLSHVSLAGIAASLLLGIHPMFGGLIGSILAILGMEKLREQRILSSDTIVSLFLFGGLALGLFFLHLKPGSSLATTQYLFGSILTVNTQTLWIMAAIGGLVLFLTLTYFWRFFTIALDEDVASAQGININRYNRLLICLGAAVIAIAIPVVGVLLIGALMVIPVLSAMQWRLGFLKTWLLSVSLSLISCFTGLILSYEYDFPAGPTIVLVTLAWFLVMLWTGRTKR